MKINKKWITGFTDAEGSFGVYVYEKKITVTFNISQKELKILEEIREYLGCGFIYKDRWLWVYKINSYKELTEKIVPIFDKNKLLTTKRLNFIDLKEAINIMNKKEHLTPEGLKRILIISKGMNTKRDYSIFKRENIKITEEWLVGPLRGWGRWRRMFLF